MDIQFADEGDERKGKKRRGIRRGSVKTSKDKKKEGAAT